jgi:hypothetical protein
MPGTWTALENAGPFATDAAGEADAMLLLTDGSVIVHDSGTGNAWWRLYPSAEGKYEIGAWTGPFNMEYQRQWFASGIMMDERVFVVGGEYSNDPNDQIPGRYSPTGEIFDPESNSWSTLPKPLEPEPAFNYIAGDTSCCSLADGRIIFGSYMDNRSAIYDPTTETWKEAGLTATGGQSRTEDCNEETWTLLPDGSVLTVCTFLGGPGTANAALRYAPNADLWVSAGQTPTPLNTGNESHEMGPALLLPDGTIFAIGATGNTTIYTPPDPGSLTDTGTWTEGPSLTFEGSQVTCLDGPAVLMPSGIIMCVGGPTEGDGVEAQSTPVTFFEYDFTTGQLSLGTQPSDNVTQGGTAGPTSLFKLLLLPTGQVLCSCLTALCLYTPDDRPPQPSWAPVITDVSAELNVGDTYNIEGQLFNGLSQAVSYGDDYTAATNYPLVQLRRDTSILYCSTRLTTLGVAMSGQTVSASFDVPVSDWAFGPANLVVIANGIPSQSVPVTYRPREIGGVVYVSGDFSRTIGGLGDGPSVTLVYRNGKLVDVIVNPPGGPHPDPVPTGDAAISFAAHAVQLASVSSDPRLANYLTGVASKVCSEFSGAIDDYLFP